jgi:hypothetical protein
MFRLFKRLITLNNLMKGLSNEEATLVEDIVKDYLMIKLLQW